MGESALPTSQHSYHNRYILMDIYVSLRLRSVCACGIALYLFENILQIKWRALVHTNSNIDLKFVDGKMRIVCSVKIFHQPYLVIYFFFFSLHVLFLRHLIWPFIVFSPNVLSLITAHCSYIKWWRNIQTVYVCQQFRYKLELAIFHSISNTDHFKNTNSNVWPTRKKTRC